MSYATLFITAAVLSFILPEFRFLGSIIIRLVAFVVHFIPAWSTLLVPVALAIILIARNRSSVIQYISTRFQKVPLEWSPEEERQWAITTWDYPVDQINPHLGFIIVRPMYVTAEGYPSSRWLRDHPTEGIMYFDAPLSSVREWYKARGRFTEAMRHFPPVDNSPLEQYTVTQEKDTSRSHRRVPTTIEPNRVVQDLRTEPAKSRNLRTLPSLTSRNVPPVSGIKRASTGLSNRHAGLFEDARSSAPCLVDTKPRRPFVSVNRPPLRLRKDTVDPPALERHDASPEHSINSSPQQPPSNETCANTNSNKHNSGSSEQPAMSPEANPYNPDAFYSHYKNELETRLFFGQNLTKSQLEWLRFPTMELPVPIGETKLVYNSYQDNGLLDASGNDLVPALEENGPISTPSSPSLSSSSLEESESEDGSSEIMTPAITSECEVLVTVLAQELSALDLGPNMPAADINDREMTEYAAAEETWEMPISPTGSVALLMDLTSIDVPPFALQDMEIEKEHFLASELPNALNGSNPQVSVNALGAPHPIWSLLEAPGSASTAGRLIKPLKKKLQGSPLKDVTRDIEMSTAAPQVEIVPMSAMGRKFIGLRRNRRAAPSPLSTEL